MLNAALVLRKVLRSTLAVLGLINTHMYLLYANNIPEPLDDFSDILGHHPY